MTDPTTILNSVPGSASQLERIEQLWQRLKSGSPLNSSTVITPDRSTLGSVDWDVVIAGGTLGILLGAALAQKGWRVCLVERGILAGRQQEWNISERELQVFLELDLLTESQLQQVMISRYNPARIGFLGGSDWWVRDVLNVGVDPKLLLDMLKQTFLAAKGTLIEQQAVIGATVHADGIRIRLPDQTLTTRLLLDAMGHQSPIVQQARQGSRPDAVCLVVGGCAQGIPAQETGDLLYTFTPIQRQCQYFWEAFPARDGRTTYLFIYANPDPRRLSVLDLFTDYLTLLPQYQQVDLTEIHFQRILFGLFPAYRDSPLQSPWPRILFVGDSSGSQSPLSFGGFGSMVRHLARLTSGIAQVLTQDALTTNDLARLQPYQPNLAVTWLFQKTMSVDLDHPPTDPNAINHLLSTVFAVMNQLGDPVLKPFLQDVVQWSGLSQTLLTVMMKDPILVSRLVRQVGLKELITWLGHYSQLSGYSALNALSAGWELRDSVWKLRQQAWKYGSGGDFELNHQI